MLVFPWMIDREESLSTLEQYGRLFSHISPTWLKVTGDGTVEVKQNARVTAAAKEYNLKLVPLATNGTFSFESAQAILTDPSIRKRAADQLSQVVLDNGWDGLCLDFEGPWAFRSEYTDLVRRICWQLQPHGRLVSLAVAAQTESPAGSGNDATWTDPYDYPALGRLVDLFIPMGYDLHGVNTLPGPVGPAWWLRQVLTYTLSCVPREKIVMGLPLYGYRWITGNDGDWQGQYITYHAAQELRREWNAPLLWDYDAMSRTYTFTDTEGRVNVVHYDDAASVRKRIELVKAYGVAGVAFWCLGLGDAAVWDELAELVES